MPNSWRSPFVLTWFLHSWGGLWASTPPSFLHSRSMYETHFLPPPVEKFGFWLRHPRKYLINFAGFPTAFWKITESWPTRFNVAFSEIFAVDYLWYMYFLNMAGLLRIPPWKSIPMLLCVAIYVSSYFQRHCSLSNSRHSHQLCRFWKLPGSTWLNCRICVHLALCSS